jgi:hypothetical protein
MRQSELTLSNAIQGNTRNAFREIWRSRDDKYEDNPHLGCDAVHSVRPLVALL